jgi:hypothetical protein
LIDKQLAALQPTPFLIASSNLSVMTELRRSTRKQKMVDYSAQLAASYPDGLPANNFERLISDLNLETFPANDYTRVDDILTNVLFATKRRHRSYRALKPASTSETPLEITKDQAIKMRRQCKDMIDSTDPSPEECQAVAELFINENGDILQLEDVSPLRQ